MNRVLFWVLLSVGLWLPGASAAEDTLLHNTFSLKSLMWDIPPDGKEQVRVTGDLRIEITCANEDDAATGFLPDACWGGMENYLLHQSDALRTQSVAYLTGLPRAELLSPGLQGKIESFARKFLLERLTPEERKKAEFPEIAAEKLAAMLDKSIVVKMQNLKAAPKPAEEVTVPVAPAVRTGVEASVR